MGIRTVIVDDEPLALGRMRLLLDAYKDDIEIVGEASFAEQAIEVIKKEHPELVFLDIQMPDKNALEMLKELEDEDFLIVFMTAYSEYALQSFEFNVLDYLTKPIDEDRLAKTIEKVRKYFHSEASEGISLEQLSKVLPGFVGKEYLQRIQAKVGNRIFLINTDEIIRFQSEDKYTVVYTPTSQYIIDTPLIDLEQKLDPRQFVRVHRAHLVAVDYISEIQRIAEGRLSVVLKDKARTNILVSRNFVKRVRKL